MQTDLDGSLFWLTQAIDFRWLLLLLLLFDSEPRRPARRPVRSRAPRLYPYDVMIWYCSLKRLSFLDPDLFLVVGGAVAHALEVVLHEVVVLLAV
jgi:hypothetical protein